MSHSNVQEIAMKLTKVLAIAVAAVVLIGGMSAVGAAAPADQAPDKASDASDEYASDAVDADDSENADDNDIVDSASGADNADSTGADSIGPNGDLPEQVPDHVSQIHETIGSYLDGSIDSLGDALRNLLGGDTSPNGSSVGPSVDAGSA